ncbi:hypothetical protein KUTeg_016834 [Tegillarca granosa]|uniref:Mab-21-like nucleotidyltransferase domain-containing protein n=1 Tax=Tegillarca granosa TaxID=220873 RepID=A0ABQ9ELZ9_TEGGR|nr:hypothetical protein KUTeg_016834 [Tegillarca granosa]
MGLRRRLTLEDGIMDYWSELKTNIKQGCVRLCFMSNNNEIIRGSFIRETVLSSRDGVFLSSLLFRDQFTAFCKSIDPKSVALGPCTLIQLAGFEIDDMWPSSANEWINRVRKRNWPSRELVNDILKNGCLLVPLGNLNSEKSFIEWRLSFFTSRKKLIHSMNQVQFLCYGLLK